MQVGVDVCLCRDTKLIFRRAGGVEYVCAACISVACARGCVGCVKGERERLVGMNCGRSQICFFSSLVFFYMLAWILPSS